MEHDPQHRPVSVDALDAAQAFAALGSEARLAVIRALVRAGQEGLTVGALQKRLEMPASTLSHHLKFLSQCGLLRQDRDGRSLICTAAFERIEALADFLTRECCLDASSCDAPPARASTERDQPES
ncbi:MAG: metalloregulator ArsR/SmtB family transcription factor [Pseudomonadota bacterium]